MSLLIFQKYVSGKALEMDLLVIFQVFYVYCCFMLSQYIVKKKLANFQLCSKLNITYSMPHQ